jgi:damage-control phosphatase, subfamily III
MTKHWKEYDVFKRQKDSTFRKSKAAITELAQRYRALVSEAKEGITKVEVRKLLFVSSYLNSFNKVD